VVKALIRRLMALGLGGMADRAWAQSSPWPATSGPPLDPALEARLDELMAGLSDAAMVGQVIQADIASITPEDVRRYGIGSVLNGGNSAPDGDVRAAPADWLALADAFHAASVDPHADHAGIPLLWATDAVHGHNNIRGATIFPHNIGLGATRNPDLIRAIGTATAREVRTTGMDWTFAPTLAVARDRRWGRTYESYAEDPALVAAYGRAMVEGLQGSPGSDDFLGPARVLATAKHFVGDGGTEGGRDRGNTPDREADLSRRHGAGYPAAIEAGVQTIMASFSRWQGERLHGHTYLLTDILRQRLGFRGLVVGDWNGHSQVPSCTSTACAPAFNAGLDMFMAPERWQALYENTLAQVRSGDISRGRLEEAVRRILRVKLQLGLFEQPAPSQRPLGGQWEVLGAPAHRAIARQAVRESLVLLKNEQTLLPLAARQRIVVAGAAANDIGRQCGGWTLSWQGMGNRNEDFPGGVSIWQGIQAAVTAAGGTAILRPDGQLDASTAKPDAAIVVFGEAPYAEFRGDVEHLDLPTEEGLQLLRQFKAAGIPTVAVLLTGRPLWVNPELNAADAFVVAWLPGTQGDGVADLLIHPPDSSGPDFKGTLAFSWPRTPQQTAVNWGDDPYDPLFPYGYGLSYAQPGTVGDLSEAAAIAPAQGPMVWFSQGRATPPWQMVATSGDLAIAIVDARTTLGDALTLRAIDHQAQEDALALTWSGTAPATVALTVPPDAPTNYSAARAARYGLTLHYRLDQPPSGPVSLALACGDGCEAQLDIAPHLAAAPLGQWQDLTLPLACWADQGVDFAQLTTGWSLTTADPLALTLATVGLTSVAGEPSCPGPPHSMD